jgi:glycosyltransferase involved in cell wall biosynthesis
LAPEKNIEAVVNAAARMPDTRFILAGDGPLKNMVRQAARRLHNIDYRGWLKRPQLLEAFDECEIMVMPSHVETFGTVAMEAMARSRMVMVSENCGIREWPELAQGLELIGRNETLATALRRVAAWSPLQRARRAAIARRQAQTFNNNTVNHWIKLLEEAAAKRPSHVTLQQVSEASQ